MTDGEVGGYQVFLLVNSSNVRFLNLFADDLDTCSYVRLLFSKDEGGRGLEVMFDTYRNPISVLLSDALSFSLALLKGMLILELGTHVDGRYGFALMECNCRDLKADEVCERFL